MLEVENEIGIDEAGVDERIILKCATYNYCEFMSDLDLTGSGYSDFF